MNIARLRHRAANLLLLVACRAARFISGRLNPEELYAPGSVEEQPVGHGPRRAGVTTGSPLPQRVKRWVAPRKRSVGRPGSSNIDEPAYPHEKHQFEKWLEKEAECSP